MVTSGAKPEYGAGGFEVVCWVDGIFTLAFLDQQTQVDAQGNFTLVRFTQVPSGAARLVSSLLTRHKADEVFTQLQNTTEYREVFRMESPR
jgi:hypothetical protein